MGASDVKLSRGGSLDKVTCMRVFQKQGVSARGSHQTGPPTGFRRRRRLRTNRIISWAMLHKRWLLVGTTDSTSPTARTDNDVYNL